MKVLAVLFVFVLCIDCGKKDILPKSLTHLTFGWNFNQKIECRLKYMFTGKVVDIILKPQI